MQKQILNRLANLALASVMLASSLACLPDAEAKPKGNGNKHGAAQGQQNWKGDDDAAFSDYWDNNRDRDRFRDWLNRSYGRAYPSSYNPPASVLARNGITRAEFEALPPGIQKKVMRGKPIPPGLQPGNRLSRNDLGRVSPISDAILDTLGLPRGRYNDDDGRRIGRLDNDAIIYNPVTGVIFDVLRGIF